MGAISCAACFVDFEIPDAMERARRKDHRQFYCPNGHTNYFPDKTSEEKEVERLRRIAHDWEVWADQYASERDAWMRALRHCPICEKRISLGRTPERALERIRLHLLEEHGARPLRLAITAGAST